MLRPACCILWSIVWGLACGECQALNSLIGREAEGVIDTDCTHQGDGERGGGVLLPCYWSQWSRVTRGYNHTLYTPEVGGGTFLTTQSQQVTISFPNPLPWTHSHASDKVIVLVSLLSVWILQSKIIVSPSAICLETVFKEKSIDTLTVTRERER